MVLSSHQLIFSFNLKKKNLQGCTFCLILAKFWAYFLTPYIWPNSPYNSGKRIFRKSVAHNMQQLGTICNDFLRTRAWQAGAEVNNLQLEKILTFASDHVQFSSLFSWSLEIETMMCGGRNCRYPTGLSAYTCLLSPTLVMPRLHPTPWTAQFICDVGIFCTAHFGPTNVHLHPHTHKHPL